MDIHAVLWLQANVEGVSGGDWEFFAGELEIFHYCPESSHSYLPELPEKPQKRVKRSDQWRFSSLKSA
jgi:hypothetical protein